MAMSYFSIGDVDFSNCVNKLEIKEAANYTAQTNAAGDTVVDYINRKRKIVVGIIPISLEQMKTIQAAINGFNVTIKFLNPKNGIYENANCILPNNAVSYYTIQSADNCSFNAFTLEFTEL